MDIKDNRYEIFILSGDTQESVRSSAKILISKIESCPSLDLALLSYSLSYYYELGIFRYYYITDSINDLIGWLKEISILNNLYANNHEIEKVTFMFPGGGAERIGMGKNLYKNSLLLKNIIDEVVQNHTRYHGQDLSVFFKEVLIDDPIIFKMEQLLPYLFVVEYSIAKMLISLGVKPDSLIGHSLGEYVAACLSNVFTLKDALGIVLERGRLFDTLPEGRMLIVNSSLVNLNKILPNFASIAAINGAELLVLSCALNRCPDLEIILKENGIEYKYLRINVAAHSSELDGILPEFTSYLSNLNYQNPSIPFASNLTGYWITNEQATNPLYWRMHLRDTVRFSDGAELVLKQDKSVLIEVGPGKGLSSLCKVHPWRNQETVILTTLENLDTGFSDWQQILNCVGELWKYGVEIEFEKLYNYDMVALDL